MKINKETLREIIKEVIEETEQARLRSGDVSSHSMAQRKAMVQGGIDDAERAAIAAVSKRLAQAAKAGNVLSGTLARRLKQLTDEIDKVLGVQQ